MTQNKHDKELSEYWDYVSFKLSLLEATTESIKTEQISLKIKEKYKNIISKLKNIKTDEKKKKEEAFIFTIQLLDTKHSPTKLSFFWAEFLSTFFEKVTIVVCQPLESGRFSFNNKYKENGFFDYNEKNNIKIFNYKESLKESSTKQLIEKLNIGKSDLFISIGHSIPFFDLIEVNTKIHRPTAAISLPTTADFITSSFNSESHTNISERKLQDLGLGVNEIDKNKLKISKSTKLIAKRKLGLSSNKINLCIAGNRLEEDLSIKKNMDLVKKLADNSDICISFIGKMSSEAQNKIGFKARFHGYRADFPQIIGAFDFMVNLFRYGNAHSALYAAISNIICLSPKNTDWDTYIVKQCIYDDADDLIKKIKKLSCDKDASQIIKQLQNEKLRKSLFNPIEAKKIIKNILPSE